MGSGRGATRDDPLLDGPWLSNEALSRLPNVGRDFDLSRDPLVRRQLLDLNRSEAQRHGDGTGRSSTMIERDQPRPAARPPEEISRPADRAAFSSRWLVEQRDATLANTAPRQPASNDAPRMGRSPGEPSR